MKDKRQRRGLYQHGAKPHVRTVARSRAEGLIYPVSLSQIPFINFHSIFVQKCPKFILKRLLRVMRLLGIDVLDQHVQVRRSNGERTIPSLPRELRQSGRLGLESFGRGGFELFHQLRYRRCARQANGKMNVVRDSANPIAFTLGVACDGGKLGVERRTYRSVKNRTAILRAEDPLDEKERERLRHCGDYRSGFQPFCVEANRTWGFARCWYEAALSALSICLLLPTFAFAQSHTVRIRIINAKTNQPIADERLNVALKVDQIGSVAMATDKTGLILVNTGSATIIRILSNLYADCRPRAELYTNYAIADILKVGLITGNLCSDAKLKAKPGELILFEIPKTFVPKYPAAPASSLPHSDENPH